MLGSKLDVSTPDQLNGFSLKYVGLSQPDPLRMNRAELFCWNVIRDICAQSFDPHGTSVNLLDVGFTRSCLCSLTMAFSEKCNRNILKQDPHSYFHGSSDCTIPCLEKQQSQLSHSMKGDLLPPIAVRIDFNIAKNPFRRNDGFCWASIWCGLHMMKQKRSLLFCTAFVMSHAESVFWGATMGLCNM